MKISVDCEFNGFGGKLISMALVSEDGQEWYEVLDLPANLEPWVKDNVVPVLDKMPVSAEHFRMSLLTFLEKFERPTIVADWYTDLVHFFDAFAGDDHTQSKHYPCFAELLPNMEFVTPKVPHNALSDARSIMETIRQNESA